MAARFAVGEVSPLLLTSLRWAGVTLIIWLIAYPTIIKYRTILVKRSLSRQLPTPIGRRNLVKFESRTEEEVELDIRANFIPFSEYSY